MEDRIRFIEHKGKQVLLVDISHCNAVDLERIAGYVPKYVTAEPRGSVLLLADFTGAEFSREAAMRLKESTVFDRPHLKRSAWVGSESIPHVFYENIKTFSQRSANVQNTREAWTGWSRTLTLTTARKYRSQLRHFNSTGPDIRCFMVSPVRRTLDRPASVRNTIWQDDRHRQSASGAGCVSTLRIEVPWFGDLVP